jgi:hypothetical protein
MSPAHAKKRQKELIMDEVERLKRAIRDWGEAIGKAEGVLFVDEIANPESRKIIEAILSEKHKNEHRKV